MEKTWEFDNILDECLERVIKGEAVEQCLADYPEHAAELGPLLRTALDAKEAVAIKPSPEFRQRASYQFQSAIREMESKKARGFFSWQPGWATVVIVVIVILLAGSGTVVAAGNSLPDEPLYQVKLATEAVRLALTPSALGKAELYVELADKRVDEIIKMADEGKVEQVEQAAERLNTHLVAMASLAIPGEEALVEREVATFEAAPAPEPAPALAPAPVEEAPQVQAEEAPPAPTLPPAPVEKAPLVTAPGAPEAQKIDEDTEQSMFGVETDEQDELRVLISHHASENSNALKTVLDRVPESVKPALRYAIEIANAGYEQALSNLD